MREEKGRQTESILNRKKNSSEIYEKKNINNLNKKKEYR